MITQSEMLAGVENPMSDPANNPCGNPKYVDEMHAQLMVNPLHLQNVIIAIAWMRANDVRADDGRLYNIDLDAVRWAELHHDPQFMLFMSSDVTQHADPHDDFAQITEMKHVGCRFRVGYGAPK